jgi:predicted neuraminidase
MKSRFQTSLLLYVSIFVSLQSRAQQVFFPQYEKEIGVPLDGKMRPSKLPGVEEGYLKPIYASSHASNLLLLGNGDLLCFWFSGTWEGESDVGIVVSRLAKGSKQWTIPIRVDHHVGESYQNPVGFQAPDGTIWLLHTTQAAGEGQMYSKVLVAKSRDNGQTWLGPEVLFDRAGAFVRQPLLVMPNGDWMLPMYYTPSKGIIDGATSNYSAIKISPDQGKTWKECLVPLSDGYVQPSVIHLRDHYVAFFRSRFADFIYKSTSQDACHWTPPVKTSLPNNNSSIQALRLRDGNVAMVFNNVGSVNLNGKPTAGPRKPLSVALSIDGGDTWDYSRNLELGRSSSVAKKQEDPLAKVPGREEYSYPAITQMPDGTIYVAFTYLRETIKIMSFTESWLKMAPMRLSSVAPH